jgi:hypothetical protein
MALEASEPTAIAATYDRWHFTFRTEGLGVALPGQDAPADVVSAHATLVKCRLRGDGVEEMSPLSSDQITISVPDAYALAATDPIVAAALGALIAAVGHIAQLQGKL